MDNVYYIKELVVESVNDTNFTVKASFYNKDQCQSQNKEVSESKIIKIDKKIIKGVLYRRNK